MIERIVTGTYETSDPQGPRPQGTVTFVPTVRLVDRNAQLMLLPIPHFEIELDAAGHFSVLLPCTDDTVEPSGWMWKIIERIGDYKNEWLFELPHVIPSVPLDLSEVVPLDPT